MGLEIILYVFAALGVFGLSAALAWIVPQVLYRVRNGHYKPTVVEIKQEQKDILYAMKLKSIKEKDAAKTVRIEYLEQQLQSTIDKLVLRIGS